MRYYADAKSAKKTKEQLLEVLKLSLQHTNNIYQRNMCRYYYLRGYLLHLLHVDINYRIIKTEEHIK
jgi:hypothetical protein